MSTSSEVRTSLSSKEYTLLLISTLAVMSGATIAPALPRIANAFPEETELTIQLILTMPALFAAFGSLFVSSIMDKFGRKKLLAVSITVYGFAGSSGFFVETIGLLLAGRAILGLCVAAIMTTSTTLIGDYYEGEFRERMIGIQAAFMTFAGVIFILLGGILAENDWHNPFAIYFLAFIFLIATLKFLNEPTVVTIDHSKGHVVTHEESISDHYKILLFAYFMAILASASLTFMIVFLPFSLQNEFGRSPREVGFAISINTLFAGFASLLYKRVVSKVHYTKMFSLIFAIMGSGYLILAFASEFSIIIIGLILMGIAFGWLIPNIMSWFFGHIHGPIRSKAVGGFTFALFTGQFVSPIIGTAIKGDKGNSFIFSVTGIFLLIMALLFISGLFTPPEDNNRTHPSGNQKLPPSDVSPKDSQN